MQAVSKLLKIIDKIRKWIHKSERSNLLKDMLIISIFVFLQFLVFFSFDVRRLFEEFVSDKLKGIVWELLIFSVLMLFAFMFFSYRRTADYKAAELAKQKAESQQEKTRDQLQRVLDAVPDFIFHLDLQLRVVWANKRVVKYAPKIIGSFGYEYFNYERGSFVDAYAKWAIDSKQIENGVQYRTSFLNTRGATYWELTGIPLLDASNNVYGAIVIARDITSRMRLENTWNLLSSVVESTDDAIYGLTLSGEVISWNSGAEAIYEYKQEEIIGESINRIVLPLDRKELYEIIERVMRSEKMERFEAVRLRKDGEKIITFTTICPLSDSTGRKIGVSAIERDISEAKLAEQELEKSREMLRNLAAHLETVREDERKEIAFEVHDELGQELTALKLDLSWIEGKLTDLQPVLKNKIVEMKELIDITIDRVGNISTKLRPDILDHFGLNAAIEWALSDFKKRSGINYELVLDPEELNLDSDVATVIFRILQETLTNVIRHSKASSIEVIFGEDTDKVELTVWDNGVGITREQIDAPESFGLFAINERARSVGGYVEITGSPHFGTKIILTIPKQRKSI